MLTLEPRIWSMSRRLALIALLALAFAGNALASDPSTGIAIAPFSRDQTVFDTGAARGGNGADIPVHGTADAPDGTAVEMRVIDAATGAEIAPWQRVAGVKSGQWSGVYPALPRSDAWLRPQVRIAGTRVAATGANSFAAGHVWALYEQSNWDRVFNPRFSGTEPDKVRAPGAVQIFTVDRDADTTQRLIISDATPLTAAAVAFANAFSASRPGEKLALALHTQPGTSPLAMVDDSNPKRDWADEARLHATITADGARVGLVTSSWIGWDAGPSNVVRLLPVITGALPNGQRIGAGSQVRLGRGKPFRLDHNLTDFYDWRTTRYALIGPQGRGKTASQRHYRTQPDQRYDRLVQAWADLHRNPRYSFFLPYSFELVGGARGEANPSGGWRDVSHHASGTKDGLERLAAMGALAILKSAGLVAWPVPEFNRAYWAPDGSYADFWMDGVNVTTERRRRGMAEIPYRYPHRTEVMGFAIDGTPARDVRIIANAGGSGFAGVRVSATGQRFDRQTEIEYGQGAAPGVLRVPEDYRDGHHLNLPVADVGQRGLATLPLRPLSVGRLPNTL